MRYSSLFVIVVFAAAGLLLAGCAKPLVSQTGDTLGVTYTGQFPNGTVFDTNNRTAAAKAGLDVPGRTYTPLIVTLGRGQVIPGFEQGLREMRVGETKQIIVPPEAGYGTVDRTKITQLSIEQEMARYTTIERSIRLPKEVFLKEQPGAIEGDTIQNSGKEYTVLSLNGSDAVLRLEVKEGESIHLPNTYWNSTIVSVGTTNVTLRHDPRDGAKILLPVGPAVVTVKPQTLQLSLALEVGDQIQTKAMGIGTVTSIVNGTVTLDFNHPFAGKTLVFDVTLVSLDRPKK